VFLEFIIDPACSIVFEAERSEKNAMERPPRDPAARLFDARMLATSLALGAAVLAGVAAAYAWALHAGRAQEEARAVAFAAIVFGNLGMILAFRSREEAILRALARPNPAFWAVLAAALAALAIALYVPAAAALFRFAAPPAADLALAALAGMAGVAVHELARAFDVRQ